MAQYSTLFYFFSELECAQMLNANKRTHTLIHEIKDGGSSERHAVLTAIISLRFSLLSLF